jgi:hypothetical protein
MFFTITFYTVVRAVVRKTDFKRVKNSNDSIETRYDNFSTCIAKLRTLDDGFVNCWKKLKLEEMCLRQTLACDCQLAKTFTWGGKTAWSLKCRAIQVVLITNFK